MTTPRTRVLLGMSGGLDSTYAARVLLDAGYEVVGAVLRFSRHTDLEGARSAAEELGIALLTIDAEERFERYVIGNFVSEYARGRTPNPCVVCNRHVKMALLWEEAKKRGFDYFATGHYARIVERDGRYAPAMAKDLKKDQSYMLWGLSQEVLSHLLTPLAERDKNEIRESAASASLSAADKKESQDICFIPDGDYAAFLRRYATERDDASLRAAFEVGDFVDASGRVLGKHRGIAHYTVGQRKHLGIALGYPAFVTAIDARRRTVTLSDKAGTERREITVEGLVFSALSPRDEGELCAEVKLRYAAKPAPCRVMLENGRARVIFDTPERNPASGQSAVFYENGVVLFGGVIV